MAFDLTTKPDNYFRMVRTEMLPFIPKNAETILEIGCADGNFGELLMQRGAKEVWGIEYEKDQADVAQKKLYKVFQGDVAIQLHNLPDGKFDAIVCNDVLEHLIDPYTVVNNLRTKLKKDGVIVSSIPNIRYFRNFFDLLFNKNWDYTESGILDKTHFRFFTYKSIRKLFEENGYEVVQMKGINATKSIRPIIFNFFMLGTFWDIKFLQFATVAKAK